MNSSRPREELADDGRRGSHPSIPVYLVHYDAPDWLRSASQSVLASSEDIQLTVVNNSKSAIDLGPEVQVIQMQRNGGFTAAANAALDDWMLRSAEFCVIGSHDLHLGSDALRLMRRAMEDDPSIGIVGPLLRHDSEMPIALDGLEEVDWISGTCMMLRKDCVREVGPFDERYKSYAEDFDLCARARGRGWGIVVVRGATAHGLGTAHPGQSPRRLANSVLYDLKNDGYAGGFHTLGTICRRIPAAMRHGRWRDAVAPIAALPLALWHLFTYRRDHPATRNPWL